MTVDVEDIRKMLNVMRDNVMAMAIDVDFETTFICFIQY
jgi:hypothetical protein